MQPVGLLCIKELVWLCNVYRRAEGNSVAGGCVSRSWCGGGRNSEAGGWLLMSWCGGGRNSAAGGWVSRSWCGGGTVQLVAVY